MMRNVEVRTKRVFDTSGALVIVMILATIVSIVMSVFADSLTMFPNEKYGCYLATVMAIGLSAHITHVWVWGRKVTYGPADLYKAHR